jgi:hypothetical protein
MNERTKPLLVAVVAVIVVVVLWFGGQWLWHQLLVMHGMAR